MERLCKLTRKRALHARMSHSKLCNPTVASKTLPTSVLNMQYVCLCIREAHLMNCTSEARLKMSVYLHSPANMNI